MYWGSTRFTNCDSTTDTIIQPTDLSPENGDIICSNDDYDRSDCNPSVTTSNNTQGTTQSEASGAESNVNELDIDSLINMNLLETARDKEFVNFKHNELINNGILYISNFMSEAGLTFLDKIYQISSNFEQTIYNRITIYPFDCPSDQHNASISWIEQATKSSFLWSTKIVSQYQKKFEKIYHYQPFRTLLSSIVLNSYENSDKLHYVYDKDSHFYFHVQRGSPYNEFTAWHYDEHHFTCAVLVEQGEFGGEFNYIQYRNITKIDERDNIEHSHKSNKNQRVTSYDNYWNDEILEVLLNISIDSGITKDIHERELAGNSHIYSVKPKRGDLYCFFGNESLHSVTQISGKGRRTSLIMSMAFGDEFIHTGGAVMSLHSNDSYIDPQIDEDDIANLN